MSRRKRKHDGRAQREGGPIRTGAHAMDGLRCIFLHTWLTLLVLTALSLPALATQSFPTPTPSAEEAEASLQLERAKRERIQIGLRESGFDPGSPDGLFGRKRWRRPTLTSV